MSLYVLFFPSWAFRYVLYCLIKLFTGSAFVVSVCNIFVTWYLVCNAWSCAARFSLSVSLFRSLDYFCSHNRRQQLDTLLAMYILKSTVNFPVRIFNRSSTGIDNIFIDISRNFTINPLISGLSDHDAELLKLLNVIAPLQFTMLY